MNYFSIDDILMNETKIKVKFKNKIDNFGFYISETTKGIPKDKSVELPYFLIKFLIENKHCELVDDLLPKDLQDDLKACPFLVNLNNFYQFFYLFLANFEEKKFAKQILTERLSKFSKLIIKENLDEDDIYFMDQTEKKIILKGRESFQTFNKYYQE